MGAKPILCSHYDMQKSPPEREGCLEHGSCKGVALCSCKGVALCCMLTAGCPAHADLDCASRANLSGHFVSLVGSASGKMHLMGSCRRTWSAVEL